MAWLQVVALVQPKREALKSVEESLHQMTAQLQRKQEQLGGIEAEVDALTAQLVASQTELHSLEAQAELSTQRLHRAGMLSKYESTTREKRLVGAMICWGSGLLGMNTQTTKSSSVALGCLLLGSQPLLVQWRLSTLHTLFSALCSFALYKRPAILQAISVVQYLYSSISIV